MKKPQAIIIVGLDEPFRDLSTVREHLTNRYPNHKLNIYHGPVTNVVLAYDPLQDLSLVATPIEKTRTLTATEAVNFFVRNAPAASPDGVTWFYNINAPGIKARW